LYGEKERKENQNLTMEEDRRMWTARVASGKLERGETGSEY